MKNSTNITIRSIKESDALPVASILKEVGWFKVINEEPFAASESRIIKYIREFMLEGGQNSDHTVLVAEKNGGEVVGYISVHWIPYFFCRLPGGMCQSCLFWSLSGIRV